MLGGMRGEACQHVAQPSLGIDVVELGGLDQGVDRGGSLAAVVGSSEEVVLAAERNHGVILPMSGRKLKFGTVGTRSIEDGFGASMWSGVLAARSFTSKWPPAWSSWWQPGCSILPPVPEWRSARRACRYRRWVNCTNC